MKWRGLPSWTLRAWDSAAHLAWWCHHVIIVILSAVLKSLSLYCGLWEKNILFAVLAFCQPSFQFFWYLYASTSSLSHCSYTTKLTITSTNCKNSHIACPSCALAVDTAAKTQARKEGSSMDSSLSPVPEVVRSVCCASQATQTQSLPVSPQPSTREKVRNMRVVRRREKCTHALCVLLQIWLISMFFPFSSSKMEMKRQNLFFLLPGWLLFVHTVGVMLVSLCKIQALFYFTDETLKANRYVMLF